MKAEWGVRRHTLAHITVLLNKQARYIAILLTPRTPDQALSQPNTHTLSLADLSLPCRNGYRTMLTKHSCKPRTKLELLVKKKKNSLSIVWQRCSCWSHSGVQVRRLALKTTPNETSHLFHVKPGDRHCYILVPNDMLGFRPSLIMVFYHVNSVIMQFTLNTLPQWWLSTHRHVNWINRLGVCGMKKMWYFAFWSHVWLRGSLPVRTTVHRFVQRVQSDSLTA